MTGGDYLKKPEKVARFTDFYTLTSSDGDTDQLPPLLAETLYAEVENQAAPILRRTVHERELMLSPEERIAFSLFLSFQFTRGRAIRDEGNGYELPPVDV